MNPHISLPLGCFEYILLYDQIGLHPFRISRCSLFDALIFIIQGYENFNSAYR